MKYSRLHLTPSDSTTWVTPSDSTTWVIHRIHCQQISLQK
uniref:Uncharacterized protein n=1 Tax=Arundo donax TaxID=35708 RepID=A0A0A9HEA9_ARUDO